MLLRWKQKTERLQKLWIKKLCFPVGIPAFKHPPLIKKKTKEIKKNKTNLSKQAGKWNTSPGLRGENSSTNLARFVSFIRRLSTNQVFNYSGTVTNWNSLSISTSLPSLSSPFYFTAGSFSRPPVCPKMGQKHIDIWLIIIL